MLTTTAVLVSLATAAAPASDTALPSPGVADDATSSLGGDKADKPSKFSPFEQGMIDHAQAHCPHNRAPKREILETLVLIERDAGFPDAARGLLLAAACRESGFRAHPGYGDNGMSAGMFQFAAWAKKRIRRYRTPGYRGDARLDWRAAAKFWSRHVAKQVKAVRAHCRGRRGYKTHAEMIWASANTSAVRAPACKSRRVDGRCTAWAPRCARRGRRSETLHWKTRHSWAKLVRAKLQASQQTTPAVVPDA